MGILDNSICSIIEVIVKDNIQYKPEEILLIINNNKHLFNIQYLKISLLKLDNETKLIIKIDDKIINKQYNIFINILNEILTNIIIKSRYYYIKTIEI